MSSKKTRVLIVEDDVEGADAIRLYLEFRGFTADVAGSGEAAIDTLRDRDPYDVVIMDLNLPGMRGEELAQRLVSRGVPRPRLIALSGDHGKGHGADPFDVRLGKPCRGRILVEVMDGLLRDAQLR